MESAPGRAVRVGGSRGSGHYRRCHGNATGGKCGAGEPIMSQHTDVPWEARTPSVTPPHVVRAMKDPKGMTIDEIEEQLRNDVYKVAHWFERAEDAGLIHGNGHHLAPQ